MTIWPSPQTQFSFWSRVKTGAASDCWLWMASQDKDGYGRFHAGRNRGKKVIIRAHRFAWQIANGRAPGTSFVCHRCDNPPCVNPDHLFLGSNSDNVDDMLAKMRHSRHEKHGMAKLTGMDAEIIRHMSRFGFSQMDMARLFKVHQATIWAVLKNRYWHSEVNRKTDVQ